METFSPLQITTDQHSSKDNQVITYNVIPRGSVSLKCLAECPMNTILMFQMNKNLLNQDIPDVILLISNLIALQPSDEQKSNPNNKEIYGDFIAAQVKSLSILAYFMKSHKVNLSDCLK
jgi:transformation/transcription domain-associated protein